MAFVGDGSKFVSADYTCFDTLFPVTIFGWFFQYANTGADEALICLGSEGNASYDLRSSSIPSVGFSWVLEGSDDSDSYSSCQSPAASGAAGVWYPSMGVLANNSNRTLYYPGGVSVTDTATLSTSTFNLIALGARYVSGAGSSGGATLLPNSMIAECAIWQGVLGQAEFNMLCSGRNPSRVRPDRLLAYVPLIADLQDHGPLSLPFRIRGGDEINLSGNHPPVSRVKANPQPTRFFLRSTGIGATPRVFAQQAEPSRPGSSSAALHRSGSPWFPRAIANPLPPRYASHVSKDPAFPLSRVHLLPVAAWVPLVVAPQAAPAFFGAQQPDPIRPSPSVVPASPWVPFRYAANPAAPSTAFFQSPDPVRTTRALVAHPGWMPTLYTNPAPPVSGFTPQPDPLRLPTAPLANMVARPHISTWSPRLVVNPAPPKTVFTPQPGPILPTRRQPTVSLHWSPRRTISALTSAAVFTTAQQLDPTFRRHGAPTQRATALWSPLKLPSVSGTISFVVGGTTVSMLGTTGAHAGVVTSANMSLVWSQARRRLVLGPGRNLVGTNGQVVPPASTEVLTVDTPAGATVGTPLTLSGTYVGTQPFGLDVSLDGGNSFAPASDFLALGSATGGGWVATGPTPAIAGSLTLLVRDHYLPSVQAPSQSFTVAPGSGGGGGTQPTETLTVLTPTGATVNVPIALTGSYSNVALAGVDYSLNGGSTWAAATGFTAAGGAWAATGPIPGFAGSFSIMVRDHAHPGVSATTGSFAVTVPIGPPVFGALGPLRVSAVNSRYFQLPSGDALLLSGLYTWNDFQDLDAAGQYDIWGVSTWGDGGVWAPTGATAPTTVIGAWDVDNYDDGSVYGP